jgi:hypothetical protein
MKLIKRLLRAICLLSATCLSLPGRAQSIDELKAKYPGEHAVIQNHEMSYKISVSEGQPKVISEETQQILYLSDQAGSLMSQYGFMHSSFNELQQYEAYTRLANDKKVKVVDFKTTDSKSEEVFYDDVKETSFDFPDVAPGAVGNLHVSLLHKDAHLLSPFFFSRHIPVVKAELRISFPKDMSVKYRLVGSSTDKISVSRETKHGDSVYVFSAKDVPAVKPYEDAPDERWFANHVVFYIEKYRDEHGQTVRWLGNPDDLYRLDRSYLSAINKEAGAGLRSLVDSLCHGTHTSEEKARRIYSWVQQHIKYIAFEQGMEGFIPRDANLVCSRRFGDCKDMSSILTLMLNTAGVTAWYTWIGTRELPYQYADVPTPLADDHMICTIKLGDRIIFLDGTDPNCVFGMPTEFIQEKQALVAIDDSSYKIFTVPSPEKERNQVVDSTWLEIGPEGLKGSAVQNLYGYYSMRMHDRLLMTTDKDMEEHLKHLFKRGSNKFNLDKFDVGDLSDKDHVRLTASFTLPDYAKHIGTDWYMNLNLFKFYEHEEIDYPKRQMPIQYNFRSMRKYVIILKVPEGYQADELPKSKSFHNTVWGFDISYEKKGNTVVLTQEFDDDHLMLQPDQFEAWNKVLEQLFPLYKESISLSKR